MLIWPYDNPQVASVVVDILGLANTIEALRLIVGSSYILISTIVIVATLVLNLFRKLAVSLLLTAFTEHRFSYLFASELWPWLKLVRF